MPRVEKTPKGLQPYTSHGVDLSWDEGDEWADGDCPFCGREGKLRIKLETGVHKCHVCERTGNAYGFLRWLWDRSDEATSDYGDLAKERGIQFSTLMQWGVCRSVLTGEWLVPGYGSRGNVTQLYRWRNRTLYPTQGLGHGLHGVNLYDRDRPTVMLCEGPWDGMRLWEVLISHKETEEGVRPTANIEASLLSQVSVLAVPGCSTFQPSWAELLAGKNVILMYDNDHDRLHPKTGEAVRSAADHHIERVCRLLLNTEKNRPERVQFLDWSKLNAHDFAA